MVFDGQQLIFPRHSESAPVEQARRQAAWLAKWLEGAVGQSVPIYPVIAIPGWFITRTGRSDVIVTNPKNPDFLTRPMKGQQPLNSQLVKQIVFQLDRHSRDFIPGEPPDKA